MAAAQQLPVQQMRAAQASAPDGAPAASASGAGVAQQQQRALPDGKPLLAGSQQAPVDVSPTPPGSTFSQPGQAFCPLSVCKTPCAASPALQHWGLNVVCHLQEPPAAMWSRPQIRCGLQWQLHLDWWWLTLWPVMSRQAA